MFQRHNLSIYLSTVCVDR